MITTEWRTFLEGLTGVMRMRVRYGFPHHDDGGPARLSVTAELMRRQRNGRWEIAAVGTLRDEVREYFPELSPLIKWHLCDATGAPLHYVATAQYWALVEVGLCEPSTPLLKSFAEDNFKKTVVFGGVYGDVLPWIGQCCGQHGVPDCQACDDVHRRIAALERYRGCTSSDACDVVLSERLSVRVEEWCNDRRGSLAQAFREECRLFELRAEPIEAGAK